MAKATKGSDFWGAVVAEAQAGAESHAAIAARHGVTEQRSSTTSTSAQAANGRAASARASGAGW